MRRCDRLTAGEIELKLAAGAPFTIRFRVPHGTRHRYVELHHKGERRVKSTSGRIETRVVIETVIAIGKDSFPVEITLTDRSDMGVPMLLGRAAVRGRYVVHPGRSFLLSREKRRS